jgi:hypothetical protein
MDRQYRTTLLTIVIILHGHSACNLQHCVYVSYIFFIVCEFDDDATL